jgi:hypothetical protein
MKGSGRSASLPRMNVGPGSPSRKGRKTVPAGGLKRTRPAKSWETKLRPDMTPKVVRDPRVGDRLLVATPMLIAAEIAAVPTGQVLTMSNLRARLAAQFSADRTCPLTTGMFAAIVAGAVREDLLKRRRPRWPIWRLVNDDGTLNPKWVLETRYRAARLREEKLDVIWAGRTWRVLGLA